jgi:hypothetical protein
MKVRTLALASIVAVPASGFAFAQGSTSPSDKGAKSDTSASDAMSKDKMAKDKTMNSQTTGSGVTQSDTVGKSTGPKSDAGDKQQK